MKWKNLINLSVTLLMHLQRQFYGLQKWKDVHPNHPLSIKMEYTDKYEIWSSTTIN